MVIRAEQTRGSVEYKDGSETSEKEPLPELCWANRKKHVEKTTREDCKDNSCDPTLEFLF